MRRVWTVSIIFRPAPQDSVVMVFQRRPTADTAMDEFIRRTWVPDGKHTEVQYRNFYRGLFESFPDLEPLWQGKPVSVNSATPDGIAVVLFQLTPFADAVPAHVN